MMEELFFLCGWRDVSERVSQSVWKWRRERLSLEMPRILKKDKWKQSISSSRHKGIIEFRMLAPNTCASTAPRVADPLVGAHHLLFPIENCYENSKLPFLMEYHLKTKSVKVMVILCQNWLIESWKMLTTARRRESKKPGGKSRIEKHL